MIKKKLTKGHNAKARARAFPRTRLCAAHALFFPNFQTGAQPHKTDLLPDVTEGNYVLRTGASTFDGPIKTQRMAPR